jgi:hypothetical protein
MFLMGPDGGAPVSPRLVNITAAAIDFLPTDITPERDITKRTIYALVYTAFSF